MANIPQCSGREVHLAHRLDYIVGGANFLGDIVPSLF
jgi:hypothetical protein